MTAIKPPEQPNGKDGASMTTATPITDAFDALMPVPFTYLYEFGSPFGGTTLRESASEYNGNRPKRSIAIYTADQLHEAIRAATERAAKQERADGVLISAYALPVAPGVIDQVRIERARQMAGPDLWAVRFRGDVLNKQGEWEWEPMPSGRDDDFIERARFSTAEEGIAAAIRASGGMGASDGKA